jgi:hypothetical protein
MRKLKTLVIVFAVVAFLGSGLGLVIAAPEKTAAEETKPEAKRQVMKKEVIGEVAGIDKIFIAVDYKSDAKAVYELSLKMDKNTKFSRKGLKDINIGDLVSVIYEETIETAEGKDPKILNRLAKVVEFRQPSKISTGEETGVLESK